MTSDFYSIFEIGREYPRSHIHDLFGGSRQSGISPSAKHPFIFIFSGSQGNKHGYQDRWENENIYAYTGHGQTGDMQFISGNRQLRDHKENRKSVFLFEYVKKGVVRFEDELEFLEFEVFNGKDTKGNYRKAIRFYLKRLNAKEYDIRDSESLALSDSITTEPTYEPPEETEKLSSVVTRIGHGAYRRRLLSRWNFKCAVTGYDDHRLLIASHIVSWKASSHKERLDVNNGLILTPTLDALFDKHLIGFQNDGKIILSDSLNSTQIQLLGINGDESISGLSKGNIPYLERHRDILR